MTEAAGGTDRSEIGQHAAAFFDLDRTLMAGSSGVFFARAAYEAGMITRGRLLGDLWQNLRFRLRGSTDNWADAVRVRVGEMLAGVAVRDLQRMTPRVLAGVLPRLYPQMLELRRRGGGVGCAAICSGGGQGDAVIIEVNGG